MNILALETATDRCSVALAIGDAVHARVDDRPRMHAKRILAMVDECLAEGGLAPAGLDAFAFGRGPGSFTGVRIAAGVVQGLALGADRPVVPVSTLAAHASAAWRIRDERRVAVCVDARMDECYWGLYEVSAEGLPDALRPDAIARPEALAALPGAGWFGVGTGWQVWPTLAEGLGGAGRIDAALLPEARDLLSLAAHGFAAGAGVSAAGALPVYLREEVAWQTSPLRSQ